MPDDIINSAIFYFICGSLDVLMTATVVLAGIGIEGNPVWSWLQPKEVLITVILLANLCLGLLVILISPWVSKHIFWRTAIKYGLYGEGVGRLVFGFLPGILIMKSAGWF